MAAQEPHTWFSQWYQWTKQVFSFFYLKCKLRQKRLVFAHFLFLQFFWNYGFRRGQCMIPGRIFTSHDFSYDARGEPFHQILEKGPISYLMVGMVIGFVSTRQKMEQKYHSICWNSKKDIRKVPSLSDNWATYGKLQSLPSNNAPTRFHREPKGLIMITISSHILLFKVQWWRCKGWLQRNKGDYRRTKTKRGSFINLNMTFLIRRTFFLVSSFTYFSSTFL